MVTEIHNSTGIRIGVVGRNKSFSDPLATEHSRIKIVYRYSKTEREMYGPELIFKIIISNGTMF